jgi:hypothetical protein
VQVDQRARSRTLSQQCNLCNLQVTTYSVISFYLVFGSIRKLDSYLNCRELGPAMHSNGLLAQVANASLSLPPPLTPPPSLPSHPTLLPHTTTPTPTTLPLPPYMPMPTTCKWTILDTCPNDNCIVWACGKFFFVHFLFCINLLTVLFHS